MFVQSKRFHECSLQILPASLPALEIKLCPGNSPVSRWWVLGSIAAIGPALSSGLEIPGQMCFRTRRQIDPLASAVLNHIGFLSFWHVHLSEEWKASKQQCQKSIHAQCCNR